MTSTSVIFVELLRLTGPLVLVSVAKSAGPLPLPMETAPPDALIEIPLGPVIVVACPIVTPDCPLIVMLLVAEVSVSASPALIPRLT